MKCLNCENDAQKESGLCTACEGKEQQKINGILYLPALGIILSVIMAPFSLYELVSVVLAHFKKTGFVSYYSLFAIFCVIALFGMSIFTALTFFRRKRRTKVVMVAYYVINAVCVCCLTLLPSLLFGVALDDNALSMLSGVVVGIIVWIPYFLFSKRVPQVFSRE
ncbi:MULTISPECIES: DUF2569 domain-containing protein [Pectobacterium]|uniref:DUF2569 domain-containing protein n=1 Tax=Pectobacterium punjabense TaxID=2108399 RepID=A0ABX6KYU9_9GAMM|nr:MULTISPECIES: DUF2569 domain-containing protein [Pectobacterium]GKW12364.1 hypothetical protein PEC301899_26460 [Pectobacterium carotovorum subsp. carotovorum]MBN3136247.1 DUF2569 domain-containing protein [Pectobacterium punjabense]MBS4431030.1 DUF2569 domain-containing protein [Pectobacterium punjabense]MBT9183061.1 DUF2569 domain-containing protein [Pectobacterium punjabense]MCE5381935.1 DUF2569 domain-containing protein [Pectobacterium punjabense]